MGPLSSLINIMTSPVAKRNGVTISAEDCAVWVEVLTKQQDHVRSELKKYYELKYATNHGLHKRK